MSATRELGIDPLVTGQIAARLRRRYEADILRTADSPNLSFWIFLIYAVADELEKAQA